jgi:hypothetical protein
MIVFGSVSQKEYLGLRQERRGIEYEVKKRGSPSLFFVFSTAFLRRLKKDTMLNMPPKKALKHLCLTN